MSSQVTKKEHESTSLCFLSYYIRKGTMNAKGYITLK